MSLTRVRVAVAKALVRCPEARRSFFASSADVADLRGQVNTLDASLRGEMKVLRGEMNFKVMDLETSLLNKLGAVETSLTNKMATKKDFLVLFLGALGALALAVAFLNDRFKKFARRRRARHELEPE